MHFYIRMTFLQISCYSVTSIYEENSKLILLTPSSHLVYFSPRCWIYSQDGEDGAKIRSCLEYGYWGQMTVMIHFQILILSFLLFIATNQTHSLSLWWEEKKTDESNDCDVEVLLPPLVATWQQWIGQCRCNQGWGFWVWSKKIEFIFEEDIPLLCIRLLKNVSLIIQV